MKIIPITLAKDLGEIYEMLVIDPRRSWDLLELRICYFQRGEGKITRLNPINGHVDAQLEDGGIVDLGPSSWKDGRITAVWIDQEQFDKIRSYNRTKIWHKKNGAGRKANDPSVQGFPQIERLMTINQAADYLTDLIGRIKSMAINDQLIQGLFNKFPGLESQLQDDVLICLIESPSWLVIPKLIQANILIQYLLNVPQNEESERFKRLKPYLHRNLPLAFWNKIPENFLLDETLWPILPEEVQMRALFQKIVQGKAVDEDIASFVNQLRDYPSADYLTNIPKEILFQPILFSALSLDKKITCLLGILQEGSDVRRKAEVLTRMSELLISPGIWQYLSQAPDAVLLEPEIWVSCPVEKKVPVLIRQIKSQSLADETKHFFISQLAAVMIEPQSDRYWDQIPSSLDEEPEIYGILPAARKVSLLVKIIQSPERSIEKEKRVSELVGILSQSADLTPYLSIVPKAVVMEKEIWRLWPAERKVPILLEIIASTPHEEGSGRGKIAELAGLMTLPQTNLLWRTIPPSLYREPEIYAVLPPELKVPLLVEDIQSPDAKDQREQKIRELAGVLVIAKNISLWRMLYNDEDLILEPPLIEIAPFEVKLRLFEPAARKLTNQHIDASFDSISLDDDDLCLAARWLKPRLAEEKRTADEIRKLLNYKYRAEDWSRVLSARAAEKAVYQFLTHLGHKTEDISIKQETNQDDKRWENYDLLTEKDAIDVKNSRAVEFDHKRYVEYRVPKFKKDQSRKGNLDVVIAGVFSPNLLPKEIIYPTQSGSSKNPVIQVLGMTNFQYIEGLREDFHREGRFELTFRREDYGPESFIPTWMFDYPEAAYPSRTWAVERINRIQWPVDQLAQANYFSPLPFILLLEKPPYEGLANWQKSLVMTIGNVPLSRRLSLPRIFLAVLTHFVNMAIANDWVAGGYEPEKVKEMLFVHQKDRQHPLFVFDPLETVATLIDNLQVIWGNEHGFIRKFKSFQLVKLGIIKGRSVEDGKWKTILAYCGTPGCHYSPLIYGVHDPCESGRLICPKCHSCGEKSCKYCQERKRQEDALTAEEYDMGELICPEEPEMEGYVDSMIDNQEDFLEDNFWG